MFMKSKIILLIVVIITAFAMGAIFNSLFIDRFTEEKFVGLENELNELNKDIDFYRNINPYLSLLDDKQYEHVQSEFEKIQRKTDEDDSNLQDLIILNFIIEVMKDDDSKQFIMNLRNKVKTLQTETAMNKDELFSKNNECAKLSPVITQQLSKDETFKFIFYSPSMNACLYVIDYHYSSPSLSKEYYIANKYRAYNASTNTKLKEFPYHYYNYPYLSKDAADKESAMGQKDYASFILENSGYNVELLNDLALF